MTIKETVVRGPLPGQGSDDEEQYVLVMGGIEYTFRTKEEVKAFIEVLFKYADNKMYLYSVLMQDTIEPIIRDCFDSVEEAPMEMGSAEQLKCLMAARILQEQYGKIYDPDQELFKVLEDETGLLD